MLLSETVSVSFNAICIPGEGGRACSSHDSERVGVFPSPSAISYGPTDLSCIVAEIFPDRKKDRRAWHCRKLVEPSAGCRDFSSSVQSGSALAVYKNSSTCYTSWLHPALTKNHHGDMWMRSCRYSALHHSTRSRPGDVRQRSNTARDRGARGWASGHKEKVSQAQQPCLHPTSHFFFGWIFREAAQSWLFDGASCKDTDFLASSLGFEMSSGLGRLSTRYVEDTMR
jgi:hypothetical protein